MPNARSSGHGSQPDRQGCNDEDGCHVDVGAFVVSGCDPAEILEAAEHALDHVAATVGDAVVMVRMLARRVRRDHRLASPCCQPVAQPFGIIGAVCDEPARCWNDRQQHLGTSQVVGLSGRDGERHGPAGLVGYGVNLSRPSAARSSDGLDEVPPFAPAAERCALMCVLSAEAPVTTPLCPLSA